MSWDTRPNFANTLQLLYDPSNRDIAVLFRIGAVLIWCRDSIWYFTRKQEYVPN